MKNQNKNNQSINSKYIIQQAKTTKEKITKKEYQIILENHGATLLKSGKKANYKSGYMISIKDLEKIDITKTTKAEQIKAINENLNLLKNSQNLGLWIENNILYIDISKNIKSRKKAEFLGNKYNQIAIWDIIKNENIFLRGAKNEK